MTLTLSTRGSALALWQAHTVRDMLSTAHLDCGVEIVTVQSTGDRDQTTDLARFGNIGIFYADQGKKRKALELLWQARAIFLRIGARTKALQTEKTIDLLSATKNKAR